MTNKVKMLNLHYYFLSPVSLSTILGINMFFTGQRKEDQSSANAQCNFLI